MFGSGSAPPPPTKNGRCVSCNKINCSGNIVPISPLARKYDPTQSPRQQSRASGYFKHSCKPGIPAYSSLSGIADNAPATTLVRWDAYLLLLLVTLRKGEVKLLTYAKARSRSVPRLASIPQVTSQVHRNRGTRMLTHYSSCTQYHSLWHERLLSKK